MWVSLVFGFHHLVFFGFSWVTCEIENSDHRPVNWDSRRPKLRPEKVRLAACLENSDLKNITTFFHFMFTADYLKTSCILFVDTMSQAESAERGKKISLRWYIPLPDQENNTQDSYGFAVAL